MSDTTTKRLAALEADVSDIKLQMTALNTAFVLDDLGRPAFDHHRQYHLAQARKAAEFDSVKLDVTKRMVQAVITSGGAAIGVGLFYWLQQALTK